MTTCPRCGRVADDEFVCAGCGAFLAGSEGAGPAATVSVRRVAVLVLVVCLLALGGAALLLHGGGGGHRVDLSIPLGTSRVELSTVPLGAPDDSSAGAGTSSAPRSHSRPSTASPTASPRRDRSAARNASPTRGTSTRPAPSSSSSPPSTSHPSPSPPPSTSRHPSPPAAPAVALGQHSSGTCGPHCHTLVVTLSGFPSGAHQVSCYDDHARQFASYTTSSTTSSGCSYDRPNASVYVIVDGTRSNTVSW